MVHKYSFPPTTSRRDDQKPVEPGGTAAEVAERVGNRNPWVLDGV